MRGRDGEGALDVHLGASDEGVIVQGMRGAESRNNATPKHDGTFLFETSKEVRHCFVLPGQLFLTLRPLPPKSPNVAAATT